MSTGAPSTGAPVYRTVQLRDETGAILDEAYIDRTASVDLSRDRGFEIMADPPAFSEAFWIAIRRTTILVGLAAGILLATVVLSSMATLASMATKAFIQEVSTCETT